MNPPTCTVAGPSRVLGTGTTTLTLTVNDPDGYGNIGRVWFGISDCSIDPAEAYDSNFERKFAGYFAGAVWLNNGSISSYTSAKNVGVTGCSGGQGGASVWQSPVSDYTNANSSARILSATTTNVSGNQLTLAVGVSFGNFPANANLNYYCMVRDTDNYFQSQTLTAQWNKVSSLCTEGDSCTLQCGQARSCMSDTCSNIGNTTPGPVGLIAPVGTTNAPTVYSDVGMENLSWGNTEVNHLYTNYYRVQVLQAYAPGYNSIVQSLATPDRNVSNVNVNETPGRTYKWQVTPINNACFVAGLGTSVAGTTSVQGYFVVNQSPTAPVITMFNESGIVITPEVVSGQNANQICATNITNRRIIFQVSFTDVGVSGFVTGGASINQVQMRLDDGNGHVITASGSTLYTSPVYNLVGPNVSFYGSGPTTSVAGNVRTVSFPIQFGDINTTLLNNIRVYAEDVYNSHVALNAGWIDTTRYLKVWSCQVPVLGTIYDSSFENNTVCTTNTSGVGYSAPYAGTKFTSLIYNGTASNDVNMLNIVSPSYNSGANYLTWGSIYPTTTFNIDFDVPNVKPRVIDLGLGTTSCPLSTITLDNATVWPYSNSVSMRVDFAGIRNQDPWFQAEGGGIRAGNNIADNVPITCYSAANPAVCRPFMTIDSALVGTGSNGIVASPNNRISRTCDPLYCQYGNANNWSDANNDINDNPNYSYFYSELIVKGSVAGSKIYSGNTRMSQLASDMGGTGVAFVNGNLSVDVGNTVPQNKFFMVIVKNDIGVTDTVNAMQGLFVADGNINIGGSAAAQIVVSGTLYSANGNINLTRGLTNTALNNNTPAILVRYRPDFIFNMPPALSGMTLNWKEGN
jgi:hypothetical protein